MSYLYFSDDEYRKQVLARYEARHKSFSKQFSILVIFGLGFLAFILVPMIAFRLEADRVARELDDKTQTIEDLNGENERLRANQAQLREEQDLLNGKLTSLVFVQGQKEQSAEVARAVLKGVGGSSMRSRPKRTNWKSDCGPCGRPKIACRRPWVASCRTSACMPFGTGSKIWPDGSMRIRPAPKPRDHGAISRAWWRGS